MVESRDVAAETNSQDQNDSFELDEDQVVERLVSLLLADGFEHIEALRKNVKVKVEQHGLNDLDELEEIFSRDPDGHHHGTAFIISANGATPNHAAARERVTEWLGERNPAFGNAPPRAFLQGNEDQRRYFDSLIKSIEFSLFS